MDEAARKGLVTRQRRWEARNEKRRQKALEEEAKAARIKAEDEKYMKEAIKQYILGVPGHYYSNEKYMASMFGFPHFVLAKTQPAQDGRFGYWYADVRMENVE